MNIKICRILATFLIFGGGMLNAQSVAPKISFEEHVHDFGEIKEQGGKVSYEFTLTNIGSKPLLINNVSASCGCTTPTWTKEPILPGKKGVVKAVYDPRNRPGTFNKSVTVYSNDASGKTVLRITGKVLPRELSIEDQFPYEMDGLRLKYINQSMLTMTNDEKRTKEIEVVNNSSKDMHLSFRNLPKALDVTAAPSDLAPGQRGRIVITYDAAQKNDYDYVRDWFYVDVNGKSNSRNRIMVTAKITEDFSSMTKEQLANAPVAVFSNTTFNFGTIKEGEKVEYEFPIENAGKSNLIIRKIKTTCGCTAAMPSKQVIAPGEKTYISATFNSRGKVGNNYKPITVITNAPEKPSQILAVKGVVVKKD